MVRTMRNIVVVVALMICVPLISQGAEGIPVAISKVSPKAIAAVKDIADGIQVVGARLVTTDKGSMYHIRTVSKGKPYKIIVTPKGDVKSVEAIASDEKDDTGDQKGD